MPRYLLVNFMAEGAVVFGPSSSPEEAEEEERLNTCARKLNELAAEVEELDRIRQASVQMAELMVAEAITSTKEYKEARKLAEEMKSSVKATTKALDQKKIDMILDEAEKVVQAPFFCAVGAKDPLDAVKKDIFTLEAALAERKRRREERGGNENIFKTVLNSVMNIGKLQKTSDEPSQPRVIPTFKEVEKRIDKDLADLVAELEAEAQLKDSDE